MELISTHVMGDIPMHPLLTVTYDLLPLGGDSDVLSISERLSIFFLNVSNKDFFVKNYPIIDSLNGYLNIDIFYSEFFASKKIEDENDYLNYARDIEKLLETKKI